MRNIKKFYQLVLQIFLVWRAGNATTMGAAVAFYTIFAIAPLFILVLTLAGFFFGQQAAQRELFGQVSDLIGKQGAEVIQSVLAAASKSKANTPATVIALIILFIGATGVFIQLQDSINAIWNVRLTPGRSLRNFIKNRLLSFAMLLGIGFLLLVSLVLSAALEAMGKFMAGIIPQHVIWQITNFAVSLGLITLLFGLIFKILPDVKITWRDVWIGAFFTALLFDLGKFLLGFYLGRSTVASAYGAAGSLVVLLMWVYYSVQILLFGAAFTRVVANKYGQHIEPIAGAEFFSMEKTRG